MKYFVIALSLAIGFSAGNLVRADVIGVTGPRAAQISSILAGGGHTVVVFGSVPTTPASFAGLDSYVLERSPGTTALQNFVLSGGLLVTEWDASGWALNTAGLLDATDSGGGFVGTSTPVTFTTEGLAAGLGVGLPNPYSDLGRTQYFRNLTGIGPGVDVLATRPGGIPVIIGGAAGAGSVLIIGFDWADFGDAGNGNGESAQLLLNAVNYQALSAVPEPASIAVWTLIGAVGLSFRGLRSRVRPLAS